MTQPNRWLFVSDVDDTLVGDEAALADLAEALQTTSAQLIIAYNSSRPCASLRQTLRSVSHLPMPDYLIGALGTEIQIGASGEPWTGHTQQFSQGWSRDKIATLMNDLGCVAHAPEFQTPFKASYDVPSPAYNRVLAELQATGLAIKIIYSGGKNLDIIPQAAGKGAIIDYLRRRLQIQPERVVVAGDSGNDLEMFIAPYRGIVVANATPELKKLQADHVYHAQSAYARGVLEGLRFWQVL